MNRIAIITYDMIPHTATWGGCQRMYYLAQSLVQRGFDVTVFSAKKNFYNDYGNIIEFKTQQLEIHNKLLRSFVYSKGKGRTGNSNNEKNNSVMYSLRGIVKKNKVLFKIINGFDQFIFNEPGTLAGFISRDWCSHNKKDIVKYLIENDISLVLISAPPFGMFSIAKYIREHIPNCKIVFDYRDPWNMWKQRSRYAYSLEKKYLKYADLVICTNQNLAKATAAQFNLDLQKTTVIANGYSEQAWSGIENEPRKKGNYLCISYVGVIDISPSSDLGYRDTSKLFQAFDKAINNMPIKLKFVGVTNPDNEFSKSLKEKYKDRIELVGVVDNLEANRQMIDSDVLMLLHTTNDNSSKYLVNGKIYDYMRANRYIFGIGSNDSIHKEMILNNRMGIYALNSVEDIYSAFNEMVRLWDNGSLSINVDNIKEFSREYQNETLAKILLQL